MECLGVLWESPGWSIQTKKYGHLVSFPMVLLKKCTRLKALRSRGDFITRDWESSFTNLNLLLTPGAAVKGMNLHKGLVSV